MKKLLIALLLFSVFSQIEAQQLLTERLQRKLNNLDQYDELVSIRIEMLNKVDAFEMHKKFIENKTPIKQRAIQTVMRLQNIASETQSNLVDYIKQNNPSVYTTLRNYWIINSVYAEAPLSLIYELGNRDDISLIDYNIDTSSPLEETSAEPSEFSKMTEIESGLVAINAPALWDLGYTGKGLLVYDYDTGVCPDHPAFKERFLANRFPMSQSWYGHFRNFPNELNSNHGTHTLGTMIGKGLASGDTVGVAPEAYWIACDLVTTTVEALPPLENIVAAYQWALDSDNDPLTTLEIPDVINNSWRWRDEADTIHCNDYIVDLMNALEAAGIASVFSGGNSGPSNTSVNAPQRINTTVVNTFSVGSINGNNDNFPISSFSTRGPLQCPASDSSLIIHPEVVAPGQNVRSSVGLNSYESKSGTSMAAPHVSGAVLLLKEAFPDLSGATILTSLYYTARDLGTLGEDNTFGMGIIDCLAAFNYLSLNHTPSNPHQNPYDIEVVEISNPNSQIVCAPTVNPSFLIRNNGDSTVYQIGVNVTLDGENLTTYTWDGVLYSGESITESVSEFLIDEDVTIQHELQVQITLFDRYEKDEYNNSLLKRFSWNETTPAPFIENFESNTFETNKWKIINQDNDRTWNITETQGIENSSLSAKMNLYNYSNVNQRDILQSPTITLDQNEEYYLKFSYAHQNRNIGSRKDSLLVEISNDCGATFKKVFAKGGDELQTSDTLDLNFEPYFSTHWEHEMLNISEYLPSSTSLVIRISTVNARQNNVYLDDVILSTQEEFSSYEMISNRIQLYPNPTTNSIKLICASENESIHTVNLIDLSGRILESRTTLSNKVINWNLSNYEVGFYVFEILSEQGRKTKSFVKK